MARKSIEDVMNEIEDFMNSCKTTALSSNKVVVPRDEFDELFGDLKVKIPAEIDRCKKIMRNKEAILMDARKTADDIIAQATAQANQMISETAIVQQANQQAYDTVELARVQANDMLAQATAQANEIQLGSMQYTNDIISGIRDFVEATLQAERANYENLISALENDYMLASANLEEVQGQIIEFTGDPSSVTKAPQMKTAANGKSVPQPPKAKQSVMQKVKQAVGSKESKEDDTVSGEAAVTKEDVKEKRPIDIPDFVATGEKYVPNDIPLEANVEAKPAKDKNVPPNVSQKTGANRVSNQGTSAGAAAESKKAASPAEGGQNTSDNPNGTKKVKKIVKKRNPVIHTPQTAQETVAKTVEAAAANKVDKSVYKANGEQSRDVPPMEGNVKRGPRVGRAMVEDIASGDIVIETSEKPTAGKSVGTIDDFAMEKKI